MHPRLLVSIVILAHAWLGRPVAALGPLAGDHEDPRFGFKISTPRDWTSVPLAVEERWLVGKYLASKTDFVTGVGGYTMEYRSDMQMVAIVSEELMKEADAKREKSKDATDRGERPFKDYKGFLTLSIEDGGFFLDSEEKTKVGDVAATCQEYKVERGSNVGPRRILTWIYHLPDVDVAVQFEALESTYAKLKPEFLRCLKSFKAIKRNGAPLTGAVTEMKRLSPREMRALTLEARNQTRQRMEKETHDKAAASAPEGWTAKKFGRFMVVSHLDEKYSKKLVEHCDAVWAWFDATFPDLGRGEYARAPILRVCADRHEWMSFIKAGDWDPDSIEIVTMKDDEGFKGQVAFLLNRALWRMWLYDRDQLLYRGLPPWLGSGLESVIGDLYVKGGKVDFNYGDADRDTLRKLVRENRVSALRDLIQMDSEAFRERDDSDEEEDGNWYRPAMFESEAFVRFLINESKTKNKKTKDLLGTYLKHVKTSITAIVAELEKEIEVKEEAQTEEEEEAGFKADSERGKVLEKRVMQEAAAKTFDSWSDADWKALNDAYQKSF